MAGLYAGDVKNHDPQRVAIKGIVYVAEAVSIMISVLPGLSDWTL